VGHPFMPIVVESVNPDLFLMISECLKNDIDEIIDDILIEMEILLDDITEINSLESTNLITVLTENEMIAKELAEENLKTEKYVCCPMSGTCVDSDGNTVDIEMITVDEEEDSPKYVCCPISGSCIDSDGNAVNIDSISIEEEDDEEEDDEEEDDEEEDDIFSFNDLDTLFDDFESNISDLDEDLDDFEII